MAGYKGKQGRKRKPTALKVLDGNPGKRPLPKNEPKPEPTAPTCPSFLTGPAKYEWKRIAPQLEKIGLLTQIDRAALAGYCQSWADYKEAKEFIAKNGSVCILWEREKDGTIKKDFAGEPIIRYMQPYPQVGIANKALQQMKSFCASFGMTPSDRSGMELPGAKEQDDPMEALISGVK